MTTEYIYLHDADNTKATCVNISLVQPYLNKFLETMPKIDRIFLCSKAPVILKLNYLLQFKVKDHRVIITPSAETDAALERLTDWVFGYIYDCTSSAVAPGEAPRSSARLLEQTFGPVMKAMTPDEGSVKSALELIESMQGTLTQETFDADCDSWVSALLTLFDENTLKYDF